MSEELFHRAIVPELESVLGRRWPVLEDGYVRVVDYMGSDTAITQAARVSYGAGTRTVHQDAGLIRYLMRHRHTTPFEMCEVKLHVRVPMDTWRQWIRHRTANVNEYSTRYSVAIDSAARTSPEHWRRQSSANKQGSHMELPSDVGSVLSNRESELQQLARKVYEERIGAGVAREQARKDLPLSTFTEAFWKIDLHNLLNFLELRMAPAAQLEIRRYAETIGNEIVRRWCPVAWDAFVDYRLSGLTLSGREIAILRHLQAANIELALTVAQSYGWLETTASGLTANRERRDFDEKLSRLGLRPPW
jgi:thymidylate synthase (FAD)